MSERPPVPASVTARAEAIIARVDAIVRERPASVLDVGCGYGKYGVLVREYTQATRVDAIDVKF